MMCPINKLVDMISNGNETIDVLDAINSVNEVGERELSLAV